MALQELTQARTELQDMLGVCIRRRLLSHKLFYEFGNKSGRLLVRALQAKIAALHIHSVKYQAGGTHSTSDRIALNFSISTPIFPHTSPDLMPEDDTYSTDSGVFVPI